VIREAIALNRLDLDLQVFEDGEKAIEMIAGLDADEEALCPRLILLDLNLPRADGFEVLEKLRNSARCRHIPVLIMTSSAAPSDCHKSTALGANGYFHKPSQYDAFLRIGDIVREHLERRD
jgi:CheY-like chemotaxis protein